VTEDVYFLGDNDRRRINAMWEEYSRRRLIRQPETPQQDKYQPPEVYLARTPSDGIPASDVAGTGTSGDDIPGSATCDIYRLLEENNGTAGDSCLRKMFIDRKVWNISSSAFEGSSWILVIRDKNGQWFALNTNGGAGGSEVGRWCYCPSRTQSSSGYWKAYLLEKSGTSRITGTEIRIKIISGAGYTFVPGVYWVTKIGTVVDDANGTAPGTATATYDLYDGVANDRMIRLVCRSNSNQYDKEYYYHPLLVRENVGSGTAD